ncbi:MAG: hypothetical protein ACOY3P_23955 [Planctomycetota bacterium]
MRRFIVYYRRGRNRWRQLQPGTDAKACKRAELQPAIRFMRDNPAVCGVAVRVGDELFNLMSVEEADTYEFTFPEAP